jgi:hypothetical protein
MISAVSLQSLFISSCPKPFQTPHVEVAVVVVQVFAELSHRHLGLRGGAGGVCHHHARHRGKSAISPPLLQYHIKLIVEGVFVLSALTLLTFSSESFTRWGNRSHGFIHICTAKQEFGLATQNVLICLWSWHAECGGGRGGQPRRGPLRRRAHQPRAGGAHPRMIRRYMRLDTCHESAIHGQCETSIRIRRRKCSFQHGCHLPL